MDEIKIVKAYIDGQSINAIAKEHYTYATSIKRILEKHHVTLRHDIATKGSLCVKDGEKLIKWAKTQGRPVTKAELARVLGKTRLSPSYFIKYPELGRYIKTREQKDLRMYSEKLYNYLKDNNILYKPNDKKVLGKSVTALLLGEYEGLAIQINIRPKYVSKAKYERMMEEKLQQGYKKKVFIVFLEKEQLEEIDTLKLLLDDIKSLREK